MEKYVLGETWPPGVSDGLTLPCSKCSKRPHIDYTVSDEEWLRVIPKPWCCGVICISCFINLGGQIEFIERIQITTNDQTLICLPSVLWTLTKE